MDLYRYDESWELDAAAVISLYSKDSQAMPWTVLIDLRKPKDFVANNIPASYNLPIQSLTSSTPSPFFDATTLERQWKELDEMLSQNTIHAYDLADNEVLVICYDGDVARVATSVLRHRGIAASSVKGGFRALITQIPHLQVKDPVSFQPGSKIPVETTVEITADAIELLTAVP